MSEALDQKVRHTVVCGGAVIDIHLEWEDMNGLPVDQMCKLEDAYFLATRTVIHAAGQQITEQLWMDNIRQSVGGCNGEGTTEYSPLDILPLRIYAFLETHGVDPGNKYADGEGVLNSPISTPDLAVAVARYQVIAGHS